MPKATPTDLPTGPDRLPEANRPGHHPEVEQDKPTGLPPGPPRVATGTFGFAFHPLFRLPALLAGVTPSTSGVDVTEEQVHVRFGLWRMTVDRDNVVSAAASGPYLPWKVVGPPHLSFTDRGITFATTPRRGVCLRLREPVPGIEPTGRLRHPGVTLTVDDPERLIDLLG